MKIYCINSRYLVIYIKIYNVRLYVYIKLVYYGFVVN